MHLVHRRDEFRASKIMVDRAEQNEKLDFVLNAVVDEIIGDAKVEASAPAEHRDRRGAGRSRPTASSSRSATTRTPRSSSTSSTTTTAGYLVTKPGSTETNVPGVFAVGDVQDHIYRQAITAAGSGCMAALDAERFLAALEGHAGTALTAPRPRAAEV